MIGCSCRVERVAAKEERGEVQVSAPGVCHRLHLAVPSALDEAKRRRCEGRADVDVGREEGGAARSLQSRGRTVVAER